jgi:hypothetical protein
MRSDHPAWKISVNSYYWLASQIRSIPAAQLAPHGLADLEYSIRSVRDVEKVAAPNPLNWKLAMPRPLTWKVRNPLAVKMPLRDWLFWYCFTIFMCSLFPLFFWVAEPSLLGKIPFRVWADSPVFLWTAGVDTDPGLLLERHSSALGTPTGEIDWTHLVAFSSNYLGPVLIAILAGSNFRIMLINCGLFFLALYYLFKLRDIRPKLLITLILINPFTIISILTVNKEIIALLAVALFVYYMEKRSWFLVPAVLAVSFLARWEQAAVFLLWMLLVSRLNPLRKHRLAAILAVVMGISIIYPHMKSFTGLWETDSHIMNALYQIQQNYMYFLVLIPKVILNFAMNLLDVRDYGQINWYDLTNSVFLLSHEVLMVVVTFAIIKSRRFRLKSDIIYPAVLITVIFCSAPLVQPRYLYAVYIFACIEAAKRRERLAPYPWESWLRRGVDSGISAQRQITAQSG